jgi:hypothetical protein
MTDEGLAPEGGASASPPAPARRPARAAAAALPPARRAHPRPAAPPAAAAAAPARAALAAPAPRGKRKRKTVTWADGDAAPAGSETDFDDDDDEAGEGGAGGEAEGEGAGAATLVFAADADPLFAGLDVAAALAAQEPAEPGAAGEGASGAAGALAPAELAGRRASHAAALAGAYADEAWALADELLLRRAELRRGDPTVRELEPGGAPPPPPAPAPVAAAAAGGGVRAAWRAHKARRRGGGAGGADAEEEEPPFEALEDFVLSLPPPTPEQAGALRASLAERRRAFASRLARLGRLEEASTAAAGRELDRHFALAAFCGRRARFLVRRAAFSLGRGAADGVDLSLEDAAGAAGASREAARAWLADDGAFRLQRVGRGPVAVNGAALARGEAARLPHLSLVRAGGVALLFVANRGALDRVARRSAAAAVS